jgi:hypothetical protein
MKAEMRTAPSPPPTGVTRRHGRRPGRRGVLVAALLIALVAAGFVVVDRRGGGSGPKSAGRVAATGLATVTRGPLSARTSVNGTLGYKGKYKAINQAKGTYTKLPHTGQIVHQGGVLYRVDGQPVVLLKGSSTPLYRDLKKGMSGGDVKQLNAALADLGYGTAWGLDPLSRYFSTATAGALKQLQDDLDVKQTGRLAKSQAVFMPGSKVRITKVSAISGTNAAPGTEVLEAGSTARQVVAAVDASVQTKLKPGDKVTITLPDGTSTPGTVTSVGTVAHKASGGAKVYVVIAPKDDGTGRLDQAPVGVSIVTDSVDDALAVPVNALLALLNGGYGIEIVDPGGAHRLAAVTLGLFDDTAGTVQITGKGVAAGQRVVVPAS